MSRIVEKFDELKRAGRKAFIPFVTAGDPDRETSIEIVNALAESGADIIELGVPFSDPMADGPTIQASSMRALTNGTTLGDVLEIVRRVRLRHEVPIVLFSYLNPVFQYGIERLASDAASAGVDGVLLTDVVDHYADEISMTLSAKGIDLISLIAPTTTDERLEQISGHARGFLYAISRTGITGTQNETSDAAQILVRRARKFTDLPIAVGFGISTASQIQDVWRYADGAVVGSAIVRKIERSIEVGDPVRAVREFVRQLLPQVAKETAEI
jgi:tryptophan synthase alpha chain